MPAPRRTARLAPLEPPYEPEIARTLERMMGGPGIEPLKLFRTVAHNPHILDKLRSTGSYLLNFGTVDPLEREIVIHRTCARCGSEYEWGVHTLYYGARLGLSEEQIRATVRGGPHDPLWTPRQQLLIHLVDELHDTATVSDELWEEIREVWTPAQLVELLCLVGQYHTVSYFTNALRVDHEEQAARFPAPSSAPR
jgi:4-carboxymuconolactone decarboxylase